MRLLVTGGGTGGHIYPALAVARAWQERFGSGSVLYVGTSRGLEARLVPPTGIPFLTVEVQGLPRTINRELLTFTPRLLRGLKQGRRILREFRPQVVLGTGGYVSFPVVALATLAGIPALLHEQNAFPGLANRLLARRVAGVALTFPEAAVRLPAGVEYRVTGLPVRPEISRVSREEGLAYLGLEGKRPVLLVTGGSRGARSINRAMLGVYRALNHLPPLDIVHITGELTFAETMDSISVLGIENYKKGNIYIKPYEHQMAHALAAADLILCRAGATTLAEITVRGLPAILVPYPYAAENHQEYNARALVQAGAAHMLLDRELNGQRLVSLLTELLQQPRRLQEMAAAARQLGRPQALADLMEFLLEKAR
ncbi:undecaprenyldiphospho-muramoylpentapeptide beta-N-acetylglucosaminyltransferase [Carboxydocella sp. ULO1]|uniref:undecaprenyldiphospho-muramoylpentapeptide beta-N-acetylglucosaminyltransferase n=1 Tax=Carboxydocella sp. ULO1 TaxID=1926599 RepID=UPI0009ACF77B|nr:undecaprenyldiphospho-muramoylpentapeptide beta-N-acetylglucosaminyltransferase [Carboxydocella sp. ULO1]GAW28791.1 UDP-N-acetylglucosamine--N-acetylmuramyl-(pentapeptide) pyrophosphoryl-undecaprenol N-acetylglucosamine transferase [Carboxydocella sp. ULO1]